MALPRSPLELSGASSLQTAKSAPRPRPRVSPERVVRSPSATPADEESDASSGSSDSLPSAVSGESQLEGEGVAEAIGLIRGCMDRGESLWTPGLIERLYDTRDYPMGCFRKQRKLPTKQPQQEMPQQPMPQQPMPQQPMPQQPMQQQPTQQRLHQPIPRLELPWCHLLRGPNQSPRPACPQ